jgi:phosphatidylserine/phosphatidylglycerophosphate/cardiolipin synthase-like enzyme
MPDSPERDLHSANTMLVPADFLQSLFVAELLFPSRRLWISSAWISDVQLVDNSSRQFATLVPDWPADRIRVSRVLRALVERGSEIVVVTNLAATNDDFLARVKAIGSDFPNRVRYGRAANLHEKGIVGDQFTLDGSMNLTFNGVYVNEENLIYRTDPGAVAARQIALMSRWRDELWP